MNLESRVSAWRWKRYHKATQELAKRRDLVNGLDPANSPDEYGYAVLLRDYAHDRCRRLAIQMEGK